MGKRSKQEPRLTDGMHSMWEFVFISQFLRVFQDKFGFVRFEPEDLENAFLDPENYTIFSIFARLLRNLLRRRDARITTWQSIFSEELDKRSPGWNPLAEGTKYSELSSESRILLLKQLIDFLCDVDDDKNTDIKEFTASFLNPVSEHKPIGQDAQNNIYWYFDDLRLYREKKSKNGTQKSWETLCCSSVEWDNLLRSFQKSANSNEKRLHQHLRDELLPVVMPLLKEHEKEKELKSKKKKSKSTRILEKEASRQEEERNALLKQEEEELERMKQEEECEKQKNLEAEHRKKGRRKELKAEEEENSKSKQERRRSKPGHPDPDDMEKTNKEQEELEKRVEEELKKQESLISAEDIESGLVPRTKRRCVIIREQTKNKKEWWDEEGLGSDIEEDDDYDSDSSDRPRRKKKPKLTRPIEIPGPPNRTYVFSTALANRASEAVKQGRFENIIGFHRTQQSSSPYLKLERTPPESSNKYEQQKAYFKQQYQVGNEAPGIGQMMPRGFGGLPGGMVADGASAPSRLGYGAAQQWQQFQLQQQFAKDRQQRQHLTQVEDNIHQLLFGGNSMNGNSVQPPAGSNGMYPRGGGYAQRIGVPGQQATQFGYPARMPAQQQSTSYDSRVHEQYRPQFQQGQYPAYSQQPQQSQQQPQQQQQQSQQQQFFQRPRQMSTTVHSPSAQSPSSDPLGANVRSPPPPYPGSLAGDTRQPQQQHMGNSPAPIPSPTSTGSPQTPLTPHAPHTPRFPSTVPSPGEPAKPPFSPTNPQASFPGPTAFNAQKQPSSDNSGPKTTTESHARPGFIELGSKTHHNVSSSQPQGAQNAYSILGNFNQSQTAIDSQPGSDASHEDSLHSPLEPHPQTTSSFDTGPPNKSPFLPPGSQSGMSAFSTANTNAMSKSFSVESLTAPSQPSERGAHPVTAPAESEVTPYGGLYYQSKYPPGMFGQPRYQYPPTMQHTGPFYNSQLQPNMYYDRGSLPVYPPGRDTGL